MSLKQLSVYLYEFVSHRGVGLCGLLVTGVLVSMVCWSQGWWSPWFVGHKGVGLWFVGHRGVGLHGLLVTGVMVSMVHWSWWCRSLWSVGHRGLQAFLHHCQGRLTVTKYFTMTPTETCPVTIIHKAGSLCHHLQLVQLPQYTKQAHHDTGRNLPGYHYSQNRLTMTPAATCPVTTIHKTGSP